MAHCSHPTLPAAAGPASSHAGLHALYQLTAQDSTIKTDLGGLRFLSRAQFPHSFVCSHCGLVAHALAAANLSGWEGWCFLPPSQCALHALGPATNTQQLKWFFQIGYWPMVSVSNISEISCCVPDSKMGQTPPSINSFSQISYWNLRKPQFYFFWNGKPCLVTENVVGLWQFTAMYSHQRA